MSWPSKRTNLISNPGSRGDLPAGNPGTRIDPAAVDPAGAMGVERWAMEFLLAHHREIPRPYLEASVVTLGNFDGVHLGHQEIFRRVVARSRELALPGVALSFYPHPLKVLRPEEAPLMLLPLKEKVKLLEGMGLDYFLCIRFTREFATLDAEDFVRDVLVGCLGAREIFVGRDYRFGKDRKGDVEFLSRMGKELNFEVKVVEPVVVDGVLVSSTRIRRLLMKGRVEEASMLLGRPYKLLGKVVKGVGRGRLLGFPTANIEPENELIPGNGVYCAAVEVENMTHPGVVNVGFNPTFDDDKKIKIEVHIIDFSGELYNKEIGVSFLKRIRDEVKFSSPEELVARINKDVEEARTIWREKKAELGGSLSLAFWSA